MTPMHPDKLVASSVLCNSRRARARVCVSRGHALDAGQIQLLDGAPQGAQA